MSGTPRFKLYDGDGRYLAATKHVEDAAILLGAWGSGTIRDGDWSRRIVFTQDTDCDAAESYDRVCDFVNLRCARWLVELHEKRVAEVRAAEHYERQEIDLKAAEGRLEAAQLALRLAKATFEAHE